MLRLRHERAIISYDLPTFLNVDFFVVSGNMEHHADCRRSNQDWLQLPFINAALNIATAPEVIRLRPFPIDFSFNLYDVRGKGKSHTDQLFCKADITCSESSCTIDPLPRASSSARNGDPAVHIDVHVFGNPD